MTASLYYSETKPDQKTEGVLWDASAFGQVNPLETDENGAYLWMVPDGWWQVRYEKEGYRPARSAWLPVPPVQTDVNIAMASDLPAVAELSLQEDTPALCFDRPVLTESLTAETVKVTVDGEPFECRFVPLGGGADGEGRPLARNFLLSRLRLDRHMRIDIVINGVQTYAGTACEQTVSFGGAAIHIPAREATCTEASFCRICGEQIAPARGHSFSTRRVAPTCTAPGSEYAVCRLCGEEKYRELPAAGHRFEEIAIAANGDVLLRCPVCGRAEVDASGNAVAGVSPENGVLYVAPDTGAEALLSRQLPGARLKGSNGLLADADALVGSGMTLETPDGKAYPVILSGDADGDGSVTSADARIALRISVKLEDPPAWGYTAAGVLSNDGAVTSADARLILRASVGLDRLPRWDGSGA